MPSGPIMIKKVFQRNSIFYKVFGVLSILVLLVMLSLYSFISDIIIENKNKTLHQTNFLRLQQASNTMEATLSTLAFHMGQQMWARDFINYETAPLKADTQRDARILTALRNEAEGNALVKNIYLYSIYTDNLFTGSKTVPVKNVASVANVLAQYFTVDFSSLPVSEQSTRWTVQYIDGRLYVFVDLYLSQRLSTLFCEIDAAELYRLIGGFAFDSAFLYVFDEQSNPLFSAIQPYPEAAVLQPESNRFLLPDSRETRRPAAYYLYTAPNTGWKYIAPIPREMPPVTMADMFRLLFPLMLLLFILSLVFSFYITVFIYRPIGRLVELFASRGQLPQRQNVNEFDYLEQAYRKAKDEQDKLLGFMSDYSSKLLAEMLKGLLEGNLADESYLAAALERSAPEVSIRSHCMVGLGRAVIPDSRPSPGIEGNLYVISLYNLIHDLENPACLFWPLYHDKDTIIIVICGKDGTCESELQSAANRMLQTIRCRTQNFPYAFEVGLGDIYHSLLDLRYSYLDARDSLHHQMYYSNQGEKEAKQAVKGRLQRIMSDFINGNKKEAADALARLLDEGLDDMTPTALRTTCQGYIDSFKERLIQLHVSEEEIQSLDGSPVGRATLPETGDAANLRALTFEICQKAGWLLYIYGRKAKYAYVEEAKEYIALNYSDSALSQNDVARHIGISASYLSEQFSALAGQSFSSYLNTFRVEKAKQLLSSTSLPVKEVGFRCGFNSVQSFIRVFKKLTLITPGQYREHS